MPGFLGGPGLCEVHWGKVSRNTNHTFSSESAVGKSPAETNMVIRRHLLEAGFLSLCDLTARVSDHVVGSPPQGKKNKNLKVTWLRVYVTTTLTTL